MAYGPKLSMIKAGDALVADTIMQNFKAIVDFLRAIPANNLQQSKYSTNYAGQVGAVGAAGYAYGGYQKVNLGASPSQLEFTAVVQMAIALAVGDTVVVTWEKCTPAGASGPKNADVWTALTASVTFNAGNTTIGVDNLAFDPQVQPPYRFCQTATLTNIPALADGDWIRCKFACTGVSSPITLGMSTMIIKGALRG